MYESQIDVTLVIDVLEPFWLFVFIYFILYFGIYLSLFYLLSSVNIFSYVESCTVSNFALLECNLV